MGRKRNKKFVKPVLFIACEGASSEYQYFESWAQTDIVLENFERVDVYPDEHEDKPKTTPYELFEKAKKVLEEGAADFAWVVFDKDMHPNLQKTFMEAEKAGVKIAFSSRSFEEWVLLHYEKNATNFDATECKTESKKPLKCGTLLVPHCTPVDCLTGHIRRQHLIPDYSKKKTFDLYKHINNRTEIAMVNASWLRFKTTGCLSDPQPALFNLNPYTDVDQLIFKLNGRTDEIKWGHLGDNITLNNWTINVNKDNDNLMVQLSHVKPHAEVLNKTFPLSSFFVTDNDLKNSHCRLVSNRYLVNTNGSTGNLLYKHDIIEYTLQMDNQPYFLFQEDRSATRIFVELSANKIAA
jgi:hypothetical protein